jgi:hypothetical protein
MNDSLRFPEPRSPHSNVEPVPIRPRTRRRGDCLLRLERFQRCCTPARRAPSFRAFRERIGDTKVPYTIFGTAVAILLAAALLAGIPSFAEALPAPGAPLPDPSQLLQRALANQKKLAVEQERYECRVSETTIETDKNGRIKKTKSEVDEQFFVNGIPIQRALSKDGRDLSPDQARKENERVMKETVKYSNQATAAKETDKQNQQIQDLVEAMMLTNGRRKIENGRSILDYNIVPNPKFQARNLIQRFARAMQGTISIDEQTGEMIDLNIKSTADLKIGGGLLASLHKGFWLHIHNHAEADGVWLNDLAEGSGDARAALFFHPYFRFTQTTGDCHLYTAKAMQVGRAKAVR